MCRYTPRVNSLTLKRLPNRRYKFCGDLTESVYPRIKQGFSGLDPSYQVSTIPIYFVSSSWIGGKLKSERLKSDTENEDFNYYRRGGKTCPSSFTGSPSPPQMTSLRFVRLFRTDCICPQNNRSWFSIRVKNVILSDLLCQYSRPEHWRGLVWVQNDSSCSRLPTTHPSVGTDDVLEQIEFEDFSTWDERRRRTNPEPLGVVLRLVTLYGHGLPGTPLEDDGKEVVTKWVILR